MATISLLFFIVLALVIWQRLLELRIAHRNTRRLLAQGAIEFGRKHYPALVSMHALFFAGMLIEARLGGVRWSDGSFYWLLLFLLAQMGRAWVMRTMKDRWTTRILVIRGEHLISEGPFRWTPHPNYVVVAVEFFSLPAVFGLYWSAFIFTILNLALLWGVRLPAERKALRLAELQALA